MLGKLLFGPGAAGGGGERRDTVGQSLCLPSILELHVLPSCQVQPSAQLSWGNKWRVAAAAATMKG